MTVVDRLRAKCARARTRGRASTFFMLDDIEWLCDELERAEADVLDVLADAS